MQGTLNRPTGLARLASLVYKHFKRRWLIYAGLVIYCIFYISVAHTGWLNSFFSGAALHAGAQGIDFYQVPNGAWAFWHGGKLTGDPLANGQQYGKPFFSNGNVYHPLFTIVVGTFLTWFNPAQSPYVWLNIKFFLSLLAIFYFFWTFRANRYVNFAVFILLTNFSIYLEFAAWQFQFILNMLLLFFLIALVKKHLVLWSGCLYWWGMLVKPIGILFVPALFFKGQWKVALIGIGCFIVYTAFFLFHGNGTYYTDNLLANLSLSGTAGPNQILTLSALLHYVTSWPDLVYKAIQYTLLALVVFLSILRRTHITKAVFLYIVYFLFFYEQVFEYQWSILAYVLAMCVVTCPEFQTRLSLTGIVLTCLPSCFVLLNLWHIDVKDLGYLGLIPGPTAWEWMIVSKFLPLILLVISVLAADIKPIFKQTKAFWQAVRKVNAQLELFGPDLEEEESTSSPLPANKETAVPVASVQ